MQRARVVLPDPDSPTSDRQRRSLRLALMSCSVSLLLVVGRHVAHADDLLLLCPRSRERLVAQLDVGRGVLRADLLVAPAAHAMAGAHLLDRRELLAALVDGPVAARRERAARGSLSRTRRPAGDAAQGAFPGDVGDGGEQLARVRVVSLVEQLVARADLDHSAGVHDGDAVGEVGDHGEVVGDVERRDTVGLGEVADRVQHVRLRGHVQGGGGLVEHDDLGPVGERHGDGDALLLAAGELVRVPAEELLVRGQQHLGHHLGQARLTVGRWRCRSRAPRGSP